MHLFITVIADMFAAIARAPEAGCEEEGRRGAQRLAVHVDVMTVCAAKKGTEYRCKDDNGISVQR